MLIHLAFIKVLVFFLFVVEIVVLLVHRACSVLAVPRRAFQAPFVLSLVRTAGNVRRLALVILLARVSVLTSADLVPDCSILLAIGTRILLLLVALNQVLVYRGDGNRHEGKKLHSGNKIWFAYI